MPQSLLAFLALMIASIAAINQQVASIAAQEEHIHSELQIMANAVALDLMETQASGTAYADLTIQKSVEQKETFLVDDFSIDFLASVTIQYVDSEGTVSLSDTGIKEVEISVFHERYATPLVVQTRMYAQ